MRRPLRELPSTRDRAATTAYCGCRRARDETACGWTTPADRSTVRRCPAVSLLRRDAHAVGFPVPVPRNGHPPMDLLVVPAGVLAGLVSAQHGSAASNGATHRNPPARERIEFRSSLSGSTSMRRLRRDRRRVTRPRSQEGQDRERQRDGPAGREHACHRPRDSEVPGALRELPPTRNGAEGRLVPNESDSGR